MVAFVLKTFQKGIIFIFFAKKKRRLLHLLSYCYVYVFIISLFFVTMRKIVKSSLFFCQKRQYLSTLVPKYQGTVLLVISNIFLILTSLFIEIVRSNHRFYVLLEPSSYVLIVVFVILKFFSYLINICVHYSVNILCLRIARFIH